MVKQAITRPVLTWLRREARRGMAIGAVCTGAQVIAEAGLLDGRRCTIHWENRDSFEEDFPEIELTPNVYVIDRDRYTAAGGTASTDLMLKLIAQRHGAELANLVADQMIHTSIRSDKDEQRLSIPTRIGVRHPKLATVIHRMEEHIEEPVSPMVLARDVGMSTRQLERLFRRYLNRSPKRYYMELRLGKARNLLMQTDMSVINVALACGFASPSHFSKCYRALYKTTPYRERGTSEAPPTRMSRSADVRSIVIVSAARTPDGRLPGRARRRLGAGARRRGDRRGAGAGGRRPRREVDELLMGCVLPAGQGQAPARQAGFAAGLPKEVPATTLNKMCGSGMKAVMLAHDALRAGSGAVHRRRRDGEHDERALPAAEDARRRAARPCRGARTTCSSTASRTPTTRAG